MIEAVEVVVNPIPAMVNMDELDRVAGAFTEAAPPHDMRMPARYNNRYLRQATKFGRLLQRQRLAALIAAEAVAA